MLVQDSATNQSADDTADSSCKNNNWNHVALH